MELAVKSSSPIRKKKSVGLIERNGIKNRDKIRSFKFQVCMQISRNEHFLFRNKFFKKVSKIRFLNDYLNNS